MRRTFATAMLSAALVINAIVPVAATTAAPYPRSMAAVGDSITQAASTGGSLGTDYPANSWSTGTNATVQSHYTRLVAAGATIGHRFYNESVSGAKISDLPGQMAAAVVHQPDYITVLIGGNDLCTNTVGSMTDVGVFREQFELAMATASSASPQPYVYVVSIPEVYQLWSLFRTNWWARTVWSLGNICQSLLANPTSNQAVDVARRQQVRDRNAAFNLILAEVCQQHVRCHHDGGAVFGTQLSRSDVSADYFHPSLAGQAKLASVSWAAGYAWGTSPPTNTPPTAAFTHECTGLTCVFTDDSTDAGGSIVSHSWSFGDGATSTAANPSRTFAAGGTYAVTLTVTDNGGATGGSSQQVTVSAPSSGITLSVTAYKVKGTKTADLSWSGATSANVDVFRDGIKVTTIANSGAYIDSIGQKGGGTHNYKVCEAGTATCSPEVAASY